MLCRRMPSSFPQTSPKSPNLQGSHLAVVEAIRSSQNLRVVFLLQLFYTDHLRKGDSTLPCFYLAVRPVRSNSEVNCLPPQLIIRRKY
jgi:hypothetical protein